MFKKRAAKGQIRKRAAVEEADDASEAPSGESGLSLNELRDEQRLRKQMRANAGIGSDSLLDAPREEADRRRAEERGAEAAAGADGGAGADASAGPSLSIADRMTSGTGEVNASTQHEKLMEQYINEQMGVSAEDAAVDGAEREMSAEDQLYAIPDHLNPKTEQPRETVTDADADGGLLAYSTGIAEVSLPMGARLANIERTEDAMRALAAEEADGLNRAARRSNIDVRLLPEGAKELGATERAMRTLGNRLGQAGVATGNMNANYNRYRDRAVMMRARRRCRPSRRAVGPRSSRSRGGGGGGRGGGRRRREGSRPRGGGGGRRWRKGATTQPSNAAASVAHHAVRSAGSRAPAGRNRRWRACGGAIVDATIGRYRCPGPGTVSCAATKLTKIVASSPRPSPRYIACILRGYWYLVSALHIRLSQ